MVSVSPYASFVRKYFANGEAIGRRFRLTNVEGAPWLAVVGVVPDMRALPLDGDGASREEQNPACFYVPMAQTEGPSRLAMAVRTDGPPLHRVPDLRAAVASLDPELPLYRVLPLDGVILRANPAFQTITGFTVEEALGHKANLMKSDRHPPEFQKFQPMCNPIGSHNCFVRI